MAREVNVAEAKTQLSQLLNAVEAGEEVVIGRAGRPVARLVPYRRGPAQRVPGAWKGQVTMSDDFFDPLPDDLLAAFNGEHP